MTHKFSMTSLGIGGERVLLDGQDISSANQRATVTMRNNSIPQVELDLLVIDTTRVESPVAEVHLPQGTIDALLALGWTPPPASPKMIDSFTLQDVSFVASTPENVLAGSQPMDQRDAMMNFARLARDRGLQLASLAALISSDGWHPDWTNQVLYRDRTPGMVKTPMRTDHDGWFHRDELLGALRVGEPGD